jgi:hypothetical protein
VTCDSSDDGDAIFPIPEGRGKHHHTLLLAVVHFGQDTPKTAKVRDHITTIDALERRSGLDVFWELPGAVEQALESKKGSWPIK